MEQLTEAQIKEIRKQNEEKKEYLLSYKRYKQKASRLQEQLEEIRLGKMFPGLIVSDMPSAHSQKDLSDYMVKYDNLVTRIIKARKQAVERFSEVQQQIEQMVNENEKTVLTLRYLRGYSWEKVYEKMGYSRQQTHRIHAKALKNFEFCKDGIE